jgi:SAM-dependent methyltransferase
MNKLNFGCGEDIKEGFDNVDIQVNPKVQKSFDFDKFPYPIKDNAYDYIWSQNVLEHLNEPDKVLHELWRICKRGGMIRISVPYYNNKGAYSDMQHKHYFSDTTFKIFVDETCKINKEKKFEIKRLSLVPTIIGRFMPKFFREKLSLFFGGIIASVLIELIVKKD